MFKNITLHIEKDYDALSRKAADIFVDAVKADPKGSYGFATGGTPEGMYEYLKELHDAGNVNLSKLTAFNLDEYYPIDPTHNQSYAHFMAEKLFDAVNLPKENRNIPNGSAPDPVAEARAYEEKIMNGKIKMQILGIGANGHIGFNEPADSFRSQTGHVALAESTIKSNARFFLTPDDVPKHAITMGVRSIMMAESILMLVHGEAKAPILWDALKGLITPLVPASVLQLHRNVIVVADEGAAKHLAT